MKYSRILVVLGLASSSVVAQAPDWLRASQVTVTLSSFQFDPATVHLHAGQPVVLHLVNGGSHGHNFSAPEFFAASQIRAQDQNLIRKGAVELSGHESKDIGVVPRAGTYKLHCTHTMHSAFGMKGEIVVD
jgi:plastocyanin